jgi:hypothetical protein
VKPLSINLFPLSFEGKGEVRVFPKNVVPYYKMAYLNEATIYTCSKKYYNIPAS